MKKLIIAMMLISSTIFASEFRYYKCDRIELCSRKLNELKWEYNIIDYKIIYSRGDTYYYSMIIELEKKGNNDAK